MLSVIIPVLNESFGISNALEALAPLRARGAEIIVVDGGSKDATRALAQPLADRVLDSPRGRAAQMNAGAKASGGELLLFLHADTLLPADSDRLIEAALQAGQCWGRFDVVIAGTHPMLSLIGFTMNLRSRWTGIATGDQAMFMRREAFDSVGGFPPLALMEDIAMSSRLKRLSPPACLRERVCTSGRRWENHGVLRTVLLMWWLRLKFFFGAAPEHLAQSYERGER